MSQPEPPTLPTELTVIELAGNNAPRTCKTCGEGAGFYVFVSNERANERLGAELGCDEWLVNAFLCEQCFREAPRVDSWDDL